MLLLKEIRTKMENTVNDSQNKIHALEEMLSKEMMVNCWCSVLFTSVSINDFLLC